ncbi:hypothetical protein TELCIR_15379 [Teladorsagia circumcincta]|uniref:Uncharacterized protein n=1 Tax=Teladorsagia circumcincta TaxID=45464 RepID=A0A2G9TYB4_TELCI|nr:hypothetical protein TELCIR_15379 [Teladorsagia circumcincta]
MHSQDGRCVPQQYQPVGNSIVAEAEAGQGTVEVTGVVPGRGHYMFLVHFFNPDNTPLNIGVLPQNDHYFEGCVLAQHSSASITQNKRNPSEIDSRTTCTRNVIKTRHEPMVAFMYNVLDKLIALTAQPKARSQLCKDVAAEKNKPGSPETQKLYHIIEDVENLSAHHQRVPVEAVPGTSNKAVHEELAKLWVRSGGSDREMAFLNAWFFLELMDKDDDRVPFDDRQIIPNTTITIE